MSRERVLRAMAADGVDVLLLGREGNTRYVSGAQRLFLAGERAFAPGCVVVRATGAVHLLSATDFGVPDDLPRANLYTPSWNPAILVSRIATISGITEATTIGMDGLTPVFEALLTSAFPAARLVDGESLMRATRRLKSPDEVSLIRAAAGVADAMMAAALDAVQQRAPDPTVIAVAMEAMADHGTTTAAFEPRVDRHDERVTVAVGVLNHGWEADLTRTVPGRSRPEALELAIHTCRPDTAVRDLASADVHGVGLGYEVLPPDDVLESGMVLSIGADGARDTVLVAAPAAEVLTGRRPR